MLSLRQPGLFAALLAIAAMLPVSQVQAKSPAPKSSAKVSSKASAAKSSKAKQSKPPTAVASKSGRGKSSKSAVAGISKSRADKSSKSATARSSGKKPAKAVVAIPGAPKQKIDVTKLEPVKSLYKSEVATKPESRSLSIFGSLASRYHYDSRMQRAAEIASSRAYAHSRGSCWRYVKDALISADLVDSRPKTAYAKEAGEELTSSYGFKKVKCTDPYSAPLGSILVYGGLGAGHVEFRTKTGFVSDFTNVRPSKRPLIGVYVKP